MTEQAEKTNQTLLRLTWLSVIFLPVVVIAGIFGMNISLFSDPRHVFGLDSEIALGAIVLALMVALGFYRYENRRRIR
jgi:Mg2+ and Co2+ transporter CorA